MSELGFIPPPSYRIFQIFFNCQTLGLVLRLRVDFVLPLSQEQPPHQNLLEGGALEGCNFGRHFINKIFFLDSKLFLD